MLRKAATLAAVGWAAAAMLAIVGWRPSYALNRPSVIRVTTLEVQHKRVDVAPHGLSAGDTDISRELLFNRRITSKPIGHGEIVCTFTGGPSRVCSGSFVLPKGRIVVGGTIIYRQLYQLAVLGGTELYDGVHGTLTVTSVAKKPPRDVLLFRLGG
jgi:hypothetical protein